MIGSKFIFFDTETTGLPLKWGRPVSDVDNWPRVIELAYIVYVINSKGEPQLVDRYSKLIKPDGWEIPNEKFWIDNGFTTERNLAHGVPIEEALKSFIFWADCADYLVAHNMDFDKNVLGAEMLRHGIKSSKQLVKICTKTAGTNYCQLPKPTGYGLKWPKLEELHLKLFGEDFKGAHQAENDVAICAKCFWEMLKLQIVKL
jgi:DNA polymerase III subunit epsilon